MICHFFTILADLSDIQTVDKGPNKDVQTENENHKATWGNVLKALYYVSTNPVVIFTSLAFTAEHVILVSGQMFLPKFIENQYFRTSGEAAIITGE